MALLEISKLELSTPLGPREIQLLVGDITKLPLEQRVDILFTSAFYGDYEPTSGSLIGSLKFNLNISVHELAKSKELDLRENFSCWVSAPLDPTIPFRRIVCFEYNRRGGTLAEQLSQVFRAMMPVFNNHETTVITPLLTTGDQGQSVVTVLRGMVNGACEWIHAGLPLSCLKIVLYSANPAKLSERDLVCKNLFAELKTKWTELGNMLEVESDQHDVCMSFTPKDKEYADKIAESLRKQSPDVSLHTEAFVFDHEQVWQKEIYSVMKNSKKIIIVLTPAYLADVDCLEQFNMALCCNQLKKEEVVVPFYMETIQSIPSYMSLVQYTECRVRKEGEMAEVLINLACAYIIVSLKQNNISAENDNDESASEALRISREVVYDVFVSYSHRSWKEPKELVDFLRTNHPDLSIFYDKSELKAGNLWQQALYEAVDKALCVIAFLSPGYIQSSVCNDEFNITLARHYAHDSILVIPVHTEALETIPRRMSSIPCVDMGEGKSTVAELAEKLVGLVARNREILHTHTQEPDVKVFKQKLQDQRAEKFRQNFKLDGGHVVRKTSAASDIDLEGEIVFSYAQDCLKLAAIMSAILKQHAPQLVTHLKASSRLERKTHLDSADMVVIFVSDDFVSSQFLVEELHTVLCRQRTVKDSTIVYFIQCDHELPTPFYFHALPFSVSMDDNIWRRLERASSNKNPRYFVDTDGMQGTYRCTASQNLSVTAAVHDVIYLLAQRGTGSTIPFNIVNIAQIENEMEDIADDQVHVHEHIITLASINHLMSKDHSPRPSPKQERKFISPYPAEATQISPGGKHQDVPHDNNVNITTLTQSSSGTTASTTTSNNTAESRSHQTKPKEEWPEKTKTVPVEIFQASSLVSPPQLQAQRYEMTQTRSRNDRDQQAEETVGIHHDLRLPENDQHDGRRKHLSKACCMF